MADDVTFQTTVATPADGTVVAADEIAGVKYQRVKISQGADGSATDVSSSAPLQVTLANSAAIPAGTNNIGDVDVLSIIPGTGATNLGKAIDTQTGTTDTGVLMLATRDDALSALTPVEGDNVQLRVNAYGAQYVAITDSTGALVDPTTQVAHDAADSGNPTKIGGYASDTPPSAVAGGDRVNAWYTRNGSAVVEGAFEDDDAFTAGTSRVVPVGMFADEASTDSVDEGDIGAPRMTLDRKVIVNPQPHTAGGLAAPLRKIDLDETPVAVKASAGQLYGFYIVNRTTSPRYLRFYNIASGSVTVGTSATYAGPFEIPSNASDHTVVMLGFGGHGIPFDTAISMAATTSYPDNDTGAPGANDLIINVFYK
jgi:hypothetical protein